MLSSLNAFGGLSAANLLMLIGANSPLPSPVSSTSAGQTAPTQASADPTTTIRSILARAQIEQAELSSGSPVIGVAESAYAAQTDDGLSLSGASTTAELADGAQQTIEQAQAQTAAGVVSATQMTDELSEPVLNNVVLHTAVSVTGVSTPTSAADATSADPAQQTDSFQIAITLGSESVEVGFSIAGLSQPTAASGEFSVGQGDLQEILQLNLGGDGNGVGVAFTVSGLDAAQAQQISVAFEQAASGLGAPTQTTPSSSGFVSSGVLAPGFSFSASAGTY